MKFYPSAILMHYWVNNNDREDDVTILRSLVKPGSIVVDIGANVGTISLPLSYHVTNNGKVIAIEASPTTYTYLHGNITFNQIENIVPMNVAIGEEEGELYFSNISSDDMNKVVERGQKGSVKVPVTTLDTIVDNLQLDHIRLLKIDIEGYELLALKGGMKALEITEIIFLESWERHFENYGYSTKDVIEFFHKNGFAVFKRVHGAMLQLDAAYISEECENLFAVKRMDDLEQLRTL